MAALFKSVSFALAAAATVACVSPSALSAQVLTQHDVSLAMGLAAATAAIEECAKAGNDVSVAVVDRVGRLRVFLQGDRAAPHNIELARRKAYTARTFSRPSGEWAERTGPTSPVAGQRQLAEVIPLRGGVPIKLGNDTIGAIGVSGSSPEGDENCAKAGVAKIADQLR